MTKLYLFRLDYAKDVTELRDMGYPGDRFPAPTKDHLFRLWDKSTDASRQTAPMMKLKV